MHGRPESRDDDRDHTRDQNSDPSPDQSPDQKEGFDRLEAAVARLAESHRHLQTENAKIRRDFGDATRRVRTLDGQLIAANQRRQDACKRIDELIAHLDQLDSQLDHELDERAEPGAPEDE